MSSPPPSSTVLVGGGFSCKLRGSYTQYFGINMELADDDNDDWKEFVSLNFVLLFEIS